MMDIRVICVICGQFGWAGGFASLRLRDFALKGGLCDFFVSS